MGSKREKILKNVLGILALIKI